MATAGGHITTVINTYLNAGGRSAGRADLRKRVEQLLRGILGDVCRSVPGPWWWMFTRGSVTVNAGDGYGLLPADFGSIGPKGRVYVQGQRKELVGVSPDHLSRRVQLDASTATSPDCYALGGQDASGRRKVRIYPTNSGAVTLEVEDYVMTVPVAVDFPGEPTVAVGSATGLTGVYSYCLTFETEDGETEAGFSAEVTLDNDKANVYALPVPTTSRVTARHLYRTEAGGSVFYRHPASLDLTSVYTAAAPLEDDTADVDLDQGTSPPDPADARTGLERIPEDWHDTLLFNELVGRLMELQGDDSGRKTGEFIQRLRAMWVHESSTQNRNRRSPRYGAGVIYPRRAV